MNTNYGSSEVIYLSNTVQKIKFIGKTVYESFKRARDTALMFDIKIPTEQCPYKLLLLIWKVTLKTDTNQKVYKVLI